MKSQVLLYLLAIDKATNTDELCSIIYRISGGNINPSFIFHNNGLIRSQPKLAKLAKSMLGQMFKVGTSPSEYAKFFQLIQQDRHENVENAPQSPTNNNIERRAWLLMHNYNNPRLFFDAEGYPI
jgi:hypothetical protein